MKSLVFMCLSWQIENFWTGSKLLLFVFPLNCSVSETEHLILSFNLAVLGLTLLRTLAYNAGMTFSYKSFIIESKLLMTLAQFHGSAYRTILRLRSRFPAYVQAPNFCASLLSVECLVTWSMHSQKPKFAAYPWNMLAVSTELPASVSANSVLAVKQSHENWALMLRP